MLSMPKIEAFECFNPNQIAPKHNIETIIINAEAAEHFEIWGGAHCTQSQAHTSSLLVFSKMAFALFICMNKLLCNVFSLQCVCIGLMAMQEEAVV